jgi:hypothetical protein
LGVRTSVVVSVIGLMGVALAGSDEERDQSMARHVMSVHMNANTADGLRVRRRLQSTLATYLGTI